jgi:Xaa-Pro aminopeptidase
VQAVVTRVDRLRELLGGRRMLVTNPVSVRYLTGFVSSNATLRIDDEGVTLYTDFRYAEAARGVAGVEFVQTARFVLGELATSLDGGWMIESDHLTVSQWEVLRAGGLELEPERGLVESLRVVKDEGEVGAIRRACAIADGAIARLAEGRFVGRREAELAWDLERFAREGGASGLSFDVAVASGPNGALPHADPGERRIGSNELVVVDWGCVVDGYCSDCTRTFATGELDDEAARVYELVRAAQERAVAAVRAGATGREVDEVSRAPIRDAGHGEAYGHGLGHGVGLLVHEAPVLRPESTDTLVAGNVVTVEPGIYLAGRFGVRIEDLVVVTDDGCDVLTGFPKELVTVS